MEGQHDMRSTIGLARPARSHYNPAGVRSLPGYNDDRTLIDLCRQGDSVAWNALIQRYEKSVYRFAYTLCRNHDDSADIAGQRSEEHTSELQSLAYLVCRLLLEKKKK